MSRKHHALDDVAGGSTVAVGSDAATGGKAVWDTGSSLYDSYELAAVRRLLDRRLVAAAGVLALRDDEPPPPPPAAGEKTRGSKIVPVSRVHRKVTLRALFRAVATWAARPRQASPLACACAGMVHDQRGAGAAVEPDLPSHGQL